MLIKTFGKNLKYLWLFTSKLGTPKKMKLILSKTDNV